MHGKSCQKKVYICAEITKRKVAYCAKKRKLAKKRGSLLAFILMDVIIK